MRSRHDKPSTRAKVCGRSGIGWVRINCSNSDATGGGAGEAYNICGDLDVSWQCYFADIARLAGLELPGSVTYEDLYAIARQSEIPEQRIVPEQYSSIPLATLALIGSDNRFPTSRLRSALGWRPAAGYEAALREIGRSLES